jgi:uncharacterized protein (UPF0332 family)
VTPEAERFLAKAGECLRDARIFLPLVPRVAGREAYLAAFHAAQAVIHERTGQVAKTHRGVRAGFLMLTRDSATIDPELREFLGRAYELKSRSDYGTGEEAAVSAVTAAAAIAMAERFIQSVQVVLASS